MNRLHFDVVQQEDGTYYRARIPGGPTGRWMRSKVGAMRSVLAAVLESDKHIETLINGAGVVVVDRHTTPPADFPAR